MTELSPAAQTVLDAANGACMYRPDPDDTRLAAAAALRAAADRVVPVEPLYGGDQRWEYERNTRQICRSWLLALAAELEDQ